MSTKKHSLRRSSRSGAEASVAGVSPREFSRPGKFDHKSGRKTLQLCSQVQDALNYLLGGDGADDLLALFQVAEVRPAPDATQLLVVVTPAAPLAAPVGQRELLDHLSAASGRLRAGVAAAITRKRAPKLLFHVAPWPATG
jgi:ribosome-binding factor A